MTITEDRLRQTFSKGGTQEIYHELKASGDFLGFCPSVCIDQRSISRGKECLVGASNANREELSQLQVILNGKLK